MTVSVTAQPEVELVNTRALNGVEESNLVENIDLDSSCYTNDMTSDSLQANVNSASQDRLLQCISWCERLQQSKLFEKDKPIPSFALARPSARSGSKTTIGLVLKGCTISELVPGGPAQCCGELQPGDRICKVNGQDVSEEIISSLLIGDDTPESKLTLTVCGKQSLNREVELIRAPASVIGDRVRLFELFAVQKEKALVEERSRVQCQSWLDHLHNGLLEMKRAGEERDRRGPDGEEGASQESFDEIQQLKERIDSAERITEQQLELICELKQNLDQSRSNERTLIDSLQASDIQRQSNQTALNDLKSSMRSSGSSSLQDQRTGLGDLFVSTKVELDKTKASLKALERDYAQSRSALVASEEHRAALKAQNTAMMLEINTLISREIDLKRSLLESSENLERLQIDLESERSRAADEFQCYLEKDVMIAKLKEEICEIRRLDEFHQKPQSQLPIPENYFHEVSELSHRCSSLQHDVNAVLSMHNRLYAAICQTSKVKPCGIGVRLRVLQDPSASGTSGCVVIDTVFEGGAAAASGKVWADDILLKIDGCDVHGLLMDEVRRRIVGLPGTSVMLHLKRGQHGNVDAVELIRSGSAQETLPTLEEQTADGCALATALYVALDQAKSRLKDSETESEIIKNSFSIRENEMMRTVSRWAEHIRNQQLQKSFELWAFIVIVGRTHKHKNCIVSKHISSSLLRSAFQQMSAALFRSRSTRQIDCLLLRRGKAVGSKKFYVWRDLCTLRHRNLAKIAILTKNKQARCVFLSFDELIRNKQLAQSQTAMFGLSRASSLASSLQAMSMQTLRTVLSVWCQHFNMEGHVRWLSLQAKKRRSSSEATTVLNSWREISHRFRQVRCRAGRLLSHSLRRSCHEYLLAWGSIIHLKSHLHRLAIRQAVRLQLHSTAWVVDRMKSIVHQKKLLARAARSIQSTCRFHRMASTFCWWSDATAAVYSARRTVDRYLINAPNEIVDIYFQHWMKVAHLAVLQSSKAALKAQDDSHRDLESNLIKQLALASERSVTLQNQIAGNDRKLSEQLKNKTELEAALANARDEIGAYRQQVDYLRKQVRDAWAASDAARADLSAAIKSSDQMRNTLFGRHDIDAPIKPASPGDSEQARRTYNRGIALSSPSPVKILDPCAMADV